MARPVNGLSFLNNGNEIIVGVKLGYARAWTGPQVNPELDFEAVRNNLLFDFTLSDDGSRVAAATHDSMIRIWSTETGTETASYAAPLEGSHRLALSVDGKKIASASPDGKIRIWNPEVYPSDADISFAVAEKTASCLAFSPDGIQLLVCLDDEVSIWNFHSLQKVGHVTNLGGADASFSSDGRFIIVGSPNRAVIWDATLRDIVFDSSVASPQKMSFHQAKSVIQTCGSTAHRMCPTALKASGDALCPLTVDSIFNFVTYHFRPSLTEFCEDIFVLNYFGVLEIFKLRK